jgi:hypothetical protein
MEQIDHGLLKLERDRFFCGSVFASASGAFSAVAHFEDSVKDKRLL